MIENGCGNHGKTHRTAAQSAESDTAAAGRSAQRHQPRHFPMGTGSFPNKRILRNNLCLPACKLLYLDKREKNFLLTDIISDIIIVRN